MKEEMETTADKLPGGANVGENAHDNKTCNIPGELQCIGGLAFA